jgi:acetyltransferase-like isoleucine patch superfamily enzyme
VLRSGIRRARQAVRKARAATEDSLPERFTVHRLMDLHEPPAPDAFATFGEGSWIVPPAEVLNPSSVAVGSRVVIMEHSRLWTTARDGQQPRLRIGDGVRLARFNTIVCGVEVILGANVASSDSVTIFDTWDHPLRSASTLAHRSPPPEPAPVMIDDGAYLGFNCIIWPGVRVGKGAFVGEGAVVIEDVPDHAVVYGNPATVTRLLEPSTGTWKGPKRP